MMHTMDLVLRRLRLDDEAAFARAHQAVAIPKLRFWFGEAAG